MCARSPRITSSPRSVWESTPHRLPSIPLATYTAASLPTISAERRSSRLTVGSSPYWSSPTSASAIARRIAGVGTVKVSLRSSIVFRAVTCQGLQQSSERRHDERRNDDRRQEVRDLHVPDGEKSETHAHEEQAADRAHLPELQIRKHSDEQRCADREAALIDKDEGDGEQNAPPERRGERDRREAVEHALHREEGRVPGEAVLDRPEERERPDAEDDRRRDESLRHGARASAREALLERLAELIQPRVDADERADDPTEQCRSE